MTAKWTLAALAALGITVVVSAQQPASAGGGQDRIAAFKQSMQEGLARIRQYEWVETTIITLKGEEKARKQNRAYYGADGKVQKVPIGGAPPPAAKDSGGGGRRRGGGGGKVKEQVVENKKEDIQEYMENAVKLIHSYVPPNAEQIQAAKDAGHVTVSPPANGRVHIEITQYVKPGDSLAVDLDAAANRLVGLAVKTYLDKPDEPITLAVEMKALPDGALYAAQTTLDAKAKNIRVVVQNAGHKPLAK
jgi:hypothetical protein